MKKALILALTMAMGLGLAAFAAGPTIGLSLQPSPGELAGVSLGYNFPNDWGCDVTKYDFATWKGNWTIAALWQPAIETPFQDTLGSLHLRVGLQSLWYWHSSGAIEFTGAGITLGIQHYWDILSGYIEARLTSTGLLTPAIGVQIEIPVGGSPPEGSTL